MAAILSVQRGEVCSDFLIIATVLLESEIHLSTCMPHQAEVRSKHVAVWNTAVRLEASLCVTKELQPHCSQLADRLMDSHSYNDAVMTFADQMLLDVTGARWGSVAKIGDLSVVSWVSFSVRRDSACSQLL